MNIIKSSAGITSQILVIRPFRLFLTKETFSYILTQYHKDLGSTDVS